MKKLFLIFLVLISIAVVNASTNDLDICQDYIKDNTTCRMVTPVINSCTTYDYGIYNENGTVLITGGNLTLLADGFYYLNFTQPHGYYLVRLCDNTSNIAYVQKSEVNMMAIEISIMAGIVAMIIILLYIAFKLDEEHWSLKFLFVSISVYMTMLIPRALYYFEPYPVVGDLVKYSTRIIYIFSIYIFLYFIWKMLDYYDKLVPIKRYFSDKLSNKRKGKE